MTLPLPLLIPSMAIETPEAAPETTTWNDSNSLGAAAMDAEAVAPAAGWADGRIFWAAGAVHTWAAEAVPAESRTARRERVFTKASLVGGPTQGPCLLFHECTGTACADLSAGGETGVLCGRCPTERHKW